MIGGGQTHSCFVAGCLDLDKRCLTSHVAFDYVSCCFYSKKLSAVCQLFVSCLSVVCQLFSRRVHVAALVPSPLSPLGPKDNRLVKSFSHVTVSD